MTVPQSNVRDALAGGDLLGIWSTHLESKPLMIASVASRKVKWKLASQADKNTLEERSLKKISRFLIDANHSDPSREISLHQIIPTPSS